MRQARADSLEPAELRRRRRVLGLTQAELADGLAVSANTVARWERGELRIGHPRQVARTLAWLERTRPVRAIGGDRPPAGGLTGEASTPGRSG